ncbi:MAG TPA: phosphodiester glycosidase family protein, partial [Acidimicrobiales bacterium]
CVTAVNGDFWDPAGRPVGAMVAGGELLTTPAIDHAHLTVDGGGRPTLDHGFDWTVAAATLDGLRVAAGAVNRPVGGDGTSFFTRRWGATTGTPAGTAEVTLDFLLPSPSALPAGTTTVRVGPVRTTGSSVIGPNQVVVAGSGAAGADVAAFAARAASFLGGLGTLTVELGGAQTVLGGSPLLLRDGRPAYPTGNADSFTQDRHARTVVGVTATGDLLLVTVDANAASAGMSLAEVTELMTGLGAVSAMNLDGGGSTTFVTGGQVRNSPPNGERPVASALALLPQQGDLLAALLDALLGGAP